MTSNVFAGAWTQPEGKTQLIVTGAYYATDTYFNNAGDPQFQPRYTKYELNPYIEYGLTDDTTLGANLSLQRTLQLEQPNIGLGDSEFFLRERLWQGDGFVLSAEPVIKLPGPNRDYPMLGGSEVDVAAALEGGYGVELFGLNHFADVRTEYRYRFGEPLNQYRINAALGVRVLPELLILPQAFFTYRAEPPKVVDFTQSSEDDHDLIKLQLSLVYSLTDSTALQIGGFSHVTGRNVGGGEGVLVAAWTSF